MFPSISFATISLYRYCVLSFNKNFRLENLAPRLKGRRSNIFTGTFGRKEGTSGFSVMLFSLRFKARRIYYLSEALCCISDLIIQKYYCEKNKNFKLTCSWKVKKDFISQEEVLFSVRLQYIFFLPSTCHY